MSNIKVKHILSKSYLTISDIDVLFNFIELSKSIDETKQIILEIYLTEDILECDYNINSFEDLDMAWFETKSIVDRFNIRECLESKHKINFKNPYEDYLTRLRYKIATINDIDIKIILNNSDYISYDELSLIYGDLLSIEKLSSIAFNNNSKLKFYFQINEDKLAVDFLGNKDEAFLNDVLKGVSTFDDWIHYVEIVEPFLEYDNNNFNGYIQAINISLENGYRAVSKGKFNSIFIDRLLFKKYEVIKHLSSIEIFPKHPEIQKYIKEKLLFILPDKPWSKLAKEYDKLEPNKNLIKEYLSRSILNLEELALIFKYFGINYDAGDVYNSLQNFELYIEENADIYEVDTKDFIFTYKNILGLEPYIDKNHQPKPITNQDDSYKYSEALKPYNDIILAFDSEYQRLSNDNIRIQSTNHIQPWLKENYKDLKDHDIRVLNNLIQTHYKLKK
ncbi:hypothetical protein [Francisella philomiragia]|uniref:hypothetical protein n=1 Tax=Francisella philomiragia TaxID=28110 RepID=UPI001B8BF0F9|nr:hypothetical protein [Francisella philomiragia]QUE31396.1 hypothetical protein IMS64_09325 [Francisella philomiragia]